MIRRLGGAVQFLTVIPISFETASPSASAWYFPVVGALLGAFAGLVNFAAAVLVGKSLAALLAIAALILLTGALHEDGLADVADAFRAGRSRDRIMQILKDSRIGAYGAIALVVVTVLRWQALMNCQTNPMGGLVSAVALSRTVLVTLAAVSRPAGDGLGKAFVSEITPPVAVAAAAQGIVFALIGGWQRGIAMIACDAALVFAARGYFQRRLGGVTGDCLGAACQAAEALNLVILACQPSF